MTMSRIGTALYMSLAVLIAFLIFTSMIKTALFSASWFNPDRTIFPVVFYSACMDFIILIVIYSLVSNVRLFPGAFNDDVSFIAGFAGLLAGWCLIKIVAILLAIIPADNFSSVVHLAEKPGWDKILVVAVTIAVIAVSREILLRGFLFQYLARGFGEFAPTFAIPMLVAVFNGRLEHYSFIEGFNLFLFNVILCYCFRMFHDLWFPAALSFSFYMTAFFSRFPVRELSFLERPNIFTGLDHSWFGSELTIFAGLPMTIALIFLFFIMHGLVKNRKILPLPKDLDYPEDYLQGQRIRKVRNGDQWIG